MNLRSGRVEILTARYKLTLRVASPTAHLLPSAVRQIVDPLGVLLVEVIEHVGSDLFLDIHGLFCVSKRCRPRSDFSLGPRCTTR